METILQKIVSGVFDINELATNYYELRTPFTGLTTPEITYESWQYSIKHLPLSIFICNQKPIQYILHLPGDNYPIKNSINKFSGMPLGWPVYNGQDINCDNNVNNENNIDKSWKRWFRFNKHLRVSPIVETDKCCEIHINMRDIYTDIFEFVSNLLLHILFMRLNNTETIVIYKNADCKKYGTCGALLKSKKNFSTINKDHIISEIDLKNPPKYLVKINKIGPEMIIKSNNYITAKFDNIFKKYYDLIKQKYNDDNFKVHIIQGARKNFHLLTTNHPEIDLSEVELSNSYGGIYKSYDEYLGKFNKKLDKSIWEWMEHSNKDWNLFTPPGLIIFLNKVIESPTMDPEFIKLVRSINKTDNVVLLNIPYAYGSEAYNIGKSIMNIFNTKLCSFQVLGKAGGIDNKLKLNDYIFTDKISIAYPNIFNISHDNETISINCDNLDHSLISGLNTNIYQSGCKNMPCVLFEEKNYLQSISSEYNAIEMEGYWYSYGLSKNIPQIYLYYISDLPLQTESLAHEIKQREEGQTLYNGLLRIGFNWIKKLNIALENTTPIDNRTISELRNIGVLGGKKTKKLKNKTRKQKNKTKKQKRIKKNKKLNKINFIY
jgi:hypothetical protein